MSATSTAFSSKKEILDFMGVEVGKIVREILEAKDAENSDRQKADIMSAVVAANKQTETRDTLKAARLLRCLAASGGNIGKAVDFANKKLGDEITAKALAEGTGSAGGYLVAPDMGELVDRLHAKSVVRQLGARVIPMPRGQISLPAGSTGATSNWVGENQVAGSSQPALRQVNMTAKKLMTIIPMSNELLEDGGTVADEWVETEAQVASALAEDLAFIRGTGSAAAPRGMRYRAATANVFNITHAGAAATLAEIFADLGKAILRLAGNNVPMIRGGWAIAPRIEWHLKTLLNSNGIPVFKDEMAKGMLFGFPYASTTQIPINLSVVGSADESEVYFTDYFSFVIGQTGEIEIEVLKGAAYYDSGTAAVVSGVSNDQTVVVLKRRVDCISLYQGLDIAVLNACDWGA